MLSTKKNFLFIHVPKTGGNSIGLTLEKYSDDKITDRKDDNNSFDVTNKKYHTNKHSPLSYYKQVLDENIYNSLYKFCVVRNPWDRLISFYFSPHWRYYPKQYPLGKIWDEKSFINLVISQTKPLRHFICTDDNKKLLEEIDYCIKFESLKDDLQNVLDHLGIKREKVLHKNKSKHKNYREYYNEKLKQLVAEKFHEEINFFGYKF